METDKAAPGTPRGILRHRPMPTPRLSRSGSLLGDLLESSVWNDDERRRLFEDLFFEDQGGVRPSCPAIVPHGLPSTRLATVPEMTVS